MRAIEIQKARERKRTRTTEHETRTKTAELNKRTIVCKEHENEGTDEEDENGIARGEVNGYLTK